jgi:hypothetical protein
LTAELRPYQQPTTTAILGGKHVVANDPVLLLESEGYVTRLLEAYPTALWEMR